MATWVLVRHGRSQANDEGWYSGHVDVPLVAEGHVQAAALVGALAGQPLARVVASDLVRAVDTARPVAQARGLRVETTPALRERHLGAWARTRHVDAPDAFRAVLYGFATRPPGGESLADVGARAAAWLAAQPDPGPTLVAAHGGVLRVLLGLLDDLDDHAIPQRFVGNADVFVREVTADRWRAVAARCDAARAR